MNWNCMTLVALLLLIGTSSFAAETSGPWPTPGSIAAAPAGHSAWGAESWGAAHESVCCDDGTRIGGLWADYCRCHAGLRYSGLWDDFCHPPCGKSSSCGRHNRGCCRHTH